MTALWAAALLAPLLLAGALVPRVTRGAAVALAPLACLPAGVLVAAGPPALSVPWLFLGVELELDTVSRPLLAVTALLYAVALAAARAERSGDPRLPAFLGVFLVACTGNFALLAAADAVTFYVGFAVMSLASYGLVVHSRTDRALRAGRVYLGMALVGEVLLLSGLLVAVADAGGPELPAVRQALGEPGNLPAAALVVSGLAVKAGTFPLHAWLPVAHPAAPVPASAVLSGAMVKAGLVGWLHLLPIGAVALPELGSALVAAGLVGIFGAVVVGLVQAEAKVQLAYSTVSQMGYLAVTVGAGLREPAVGAAAVAVAVVYAAAHGTAKAALFLSVPVVKAASQGRRRGLALGGVALAGLALAGLPPLNGFVAKYGLKELADAAAVPEVVLSVGAVGTLLLLGRFWTTLAAEPTVPARWTVLESGWLLLLITGPVLVWALAADAPPATPGTTLAALWAGTWPVLLGLALVALGRSGSGRRWSSRAPRVPAGDLVVVYEPAAAGALRVLDVAGRLPGQLVQSSVAVAHAVAARLPADAVEVLRLARWRAVGSLALTVLVVLAGVLLA
ncbi:proton-conducting transporter membrane subunit [Trujillonella humicola]|uniref:proton-conducting transporter transmembrane domain-containing protein n=1 Tax=Trujillonella humicola TaxID=3383699 RepID=UPI0039061152